MKKLVVLTISMVISTCIFAAAPVKQKINSKADSHSSVIYISGKKEFTANLNNNSICLVDFYADWCPPCKMLSPTIDKLAKQYDGKVKVLKVNVDNNQELAGQYNVRGIPNIIIFKDGKVFKNLVGFKPQTAYTAILDKMLK